MAVITPRYELLTDFEDIEIALCEDTVKELNRTLVREKLAKAKEISWVNLKENCYFPVITRNGVRYTLYVVRTEYELREVTPEHDTLLNDWAAE